MRAISLALATASVLCCATPATAGLTFILNNTGGVEPGTAARAGFEQAAARWASVLTNDVTIRLDVGFRALSSGVLGSAGSSRATFAYGSVRNALTTSRTSSADASSVASLGSTLSFLSNEAGNCETLVGCTAGNVASRTLDADNTYDNRYVLGQTTLLKALGLRSDTGARDASVTFSTAYSWDFNAADGVSGYDFVGIATHEIGHALGFTSGVDSADSYIGRTGLDRIAWGTILDLFRYTGTQRDWTVGGAPCTSADGGLTCIGLMSTGRKYGDGKQASHWKDNRGIGILDPSASRGERLAITSADLLGFDIIGWNLAPGARMGDFGLNGFSWGEGSLDPDDDWDLELIRAPVPAPPAIALLGLGMLGIALARRCD